MQELLSSISAWALKQAYHQTFKEVYGHIKVVQRLERAYQILTQSTEYEITSLSGNLYEVTSPHATYFVEVGSQKCSCPDGEVLCKHRLAIRMICRAQELEEKHT